MHSNTPAVLEVLLDAGAEVNAQSKKGRPPLHTAVGYRYYSDIPAIVEMLLDAGADPKTKDGSGKTPWDLAQKNSALKGTNAYWRLNDGQFQ